MNTFFLTFLHVWSLANQLIYIMLSLSKCAEGVHITSLNGPPPISPIPSISVEWLSSPHHGCPNSHTVRIEKITTAYLVLQELCFWCLCLICCLLLSYIHICPWILTYISSYLIQDWNYHHFKCNSDNLKQLLIT